MESILRTSGCEVLDSKGICLSSLMTFAQMLNVWSQSESTTYFLRKILYQLQLRFTTVSQDILGPLFSAEKCVQNDPVSLGLGDIHCYLF